MCTATRRTGQERAKQSNATQRMSFHADEELGDKDRLAARMELIKIARKTKSKCKLKLKLKLKPKPKHESPSECYDRRSAPSFLSRTRRVSQPKWRTNYSSLGTWRVSDACHQHHYHPCHRRIQPGLNFLCSLHSTLQLSTVRRIG